MKILKLVLIGMLIFLFAGTQVALAASISVSSTSASLNEDQAVTLAEVSTIVDDSLGGEATELNAPHDLFVKGDYVYVVSRSDDSLSIFDISDPAIPTEVGTIKDGIGATQMNGAQELEVVGDYAYVVSNFDESISIFDISDPTDITEVGVATTTYSSGGPYIDLQGDYAYITWEDWYVFNVYDISDKSNPVEVGCISALSGDCSPDNVVESIDAPNQVRVQGDYAYIAQEGSSFLILDISNPSNPIEVGSTTDNDGNATLLLAVEAIDVQGDYAYLVSGTEGFSIFDISDPTVPTEVGAIDDKDTSLSGMERIHVVGDYAYITDLSLDQLGIFDISDPTNPTEFAVIRDSIGATELDGANYIYVSGNYIYTTARIDDSLSIFEATGPYKTLTYTLDIAPTSDVTITPSSNSEVSISPTSLTFTPDNWQEPQSISVTAVDDSDYELDHSATITHSVSSSDGNYDGLSISNISVSITDNEPVQAGNTLNKRPTNNDDEEEDVGQSEEDEDEQIDEDEDVDELTPEEIEDFQRQIDEIREIILELIKEIERRFGL